MHTESDEELDASQQYLQRMIRLAICGGWISLLLSTICLYISIQQYGIDYEGPSAYYALWLTTARIFGLGAFATGALGIATQRWTHGTLLFIGSITLPAISLHLLGSL